MIFFWDFLERRDEGKEEKEEKGNSLCRIGSTTMQFFELELARMCYELAKAAVCTVPKKLYFCFERHIRKAR